MAAGVSHDHFVILIGCNKQRIRRVADGYVIKRQIVGSELSECGKNRNKSTTIKKWRQ